MEGITVTAAAVLGAALLQRLGAPRLRRPALGPEDPVPDFTGLGATPWVVVAAALAALATLPPTPLPAALPWLVHATLAAPLILVDWRTTYLPNQWMHPYWGLLAASFLPMLWWSPGRVLAAALGAAATGAIFWVVWRLGRGLGYGDVRLAPCVGALAGADGATAWGLALVLATGCGALAALVSAVFLQGRPTPYGPWLWLGPVLGRWLTGW